MCGFVGFTGNTLPLEQKQQVCTAMMDKIAHRGPDAAGLYTDEDVALGFRRLSIIDLATGDQPLYNEDESLVLTFNGEIYNFKELREDLLKKGHIFKTKSDSEVLIHGYEEYGQKLPEMLRGMFAFVIWNKAEKSIFAARDPFGIKPFYYSLQDSGLFFGSEIKAFLAHPEFIKEFNEEILPHYLSYQYSPLGETFFKNVFTLKPGHYMTYKSGTLQKTRYFAAKFDPQPGTLEEYADKISAAMQNSVAAHKISDVEVGSFLSSGIDSSYIVDTARVDKTFTVGFGDGKYSEIGYAKQFSESIGIKNISKKITAEEYFDVFPSVQYFMDEPLADPSAVALYFVCRLAKDYVKVILSGEGADELFGGYRIYSEPLSGGAYTKLPFWFRRMVSKVAAAMPHVPGVNFLIRKGLKDDEKYIGNAHIFTKKERDRVLLFGKGAPDEFTIVKHIYNDARREDTTTKMQLVDINMWLIGDILQKADKMSMANSIEVRVPFLDREVMKVAAQVPPELRVSKTQTKMALRAAAAKTLPAFTAEKPKLGFPVPVREWLKDDTYCKPMEQVLFSKTSQLFFDQAELRRLLTQHQKGKRDNSRKIWTVYTFLIWYGQYFGK